jgi:hypothetical protein
MAGSGQHFIPRHFLKPFVIQDGSDKLWMYRRNLTHPVPVDRGDAAKQKHFYSKPSKDGRPTLDDLITDYEKHVFLQVDALRALNIGEEADPRMVGEVAFVYSFRAHKNFHDGRGSEHGAGFGQAGRKPCQGFWDREPGGKPCS